MVAMKPSTVLVVHGDESMRTSLSYLLGSVGYETSIARTGAEALAITNTTPDVAIIDGRLYEMKAWDLTRALRQQYANVEFIWVSGYMTRYVLVQAVRSRVFDYIEVPFDCEMFIASVAAAIDRQRLPLAHDASGRCGRSLAGLLQREREFEETNPLRRWRVRNKVTALQTAALLGVDPLQINRWEGGLEVPRDLDRIGVLLGEPTLAQQWQQWIAEYANASPFGAPRLEPPPLA